MVLRDQDVDPPPERSARHRDRRELPVRVLGPENGRTVGGGGVVFVLVVKDLDDDDEDGPFRKFYHLEELAAFVVVGDAKRGTGLLHNLVGGEVDRWRLRSQEHGDRGGDPCLEDIEDGLGVFS